MIGEHQEHAHIIHTLGVRSGRAHIEGSRLTVADLVLMHLRLGQSPAEIAGRYALSLAAVYTALAYYYDHQDEIDHAIREDEALAESLRQRDPSPLRQKLMALT